MKKRWKNRNEKDGVAAVALQVRSGPGISYRPIGKLEKGARVVVRETQADWLRIVPPPGCRLWVSSEYIKPAGGSFTPPMPAPPDSAKPQPVKPAAAPPTPVTVIPPPPSDRVDVRSVPSVPSAPPATPPAPRLSDARSALPPELDGRVLVATATQGTRVDMEGQVAKSGVVWRRPSKHRLVHWDSRGQEVTACYLLGAADRVESLLGERARVRGRLFWLEGVRHPAVVIEQITAASSP